MHIAIYLTNPEPEGFGVGDRNYGDMFEDMLRPLMRGARFSHFDVVNGKFPADPSGFDAVVITGSSAFVTDSDPWITTLFEHIRVLDAAKTKLFAVCFGHQAVAMALGGRVEHRDVVLGAPVIEIATPKDWMRPVATSLRLFSGNFQQVVEAPKSLEVLASHPDCPVVMMARGGHLMTVQFHPEFSGDYMHKYVDQISDAISVECALAARAQIDAGADGALFAKWAAAFLVG